MPAGPVEEISARFVEYLRTRRGLAAATVASYASQTVVFLRWRLDRYGGDWGSLTAGQVHEFVYLSAQGQRPRSVQVEVNALRALLRWMGTQRLVAVAGLAEGLGPVAAGTVAALPKALTDAQVGQLFAVLPTAGPARLRNEAVLALLWRMGMRAGEVAGLLLDDIDWRAGVILVRGKGERHDRVPLHVDVGGLLAAYLAGLSSVVARAAARAGITYPVHAHRLRHTTACRVLAGGGGVGGSVWVVVPDTSPYRRSHQQRAPGVQFRSMSLHVDCPGTDGWYAWHARL